MALFIVLWLLTPANKCRRPWVVISKMQLKEGGL
jgi:hypothetical protein